MRAVLIEALVIGLLASIVGILLGLGLAEGLFWLFDQVGFTLPNSGLLQTRTIIVALIVGVLVTVIASLRPARRATRVPPIAAVREGARCRRTFLSLPGPSARRCSASRASRCSPAACSARALHDAAAPGHGRRRRADLLRGRVLLGPARDAALARPGRPGGKVRGRSGDPRARECDAEPPAHLPRRPPRS